MVLPAGLTKDEREEWHFMCSVQRLHSFSRGVGASRRLFIGRTRLAIADADGKWTRGTGAGGSGSEERAQAQALHDLAAESQGGHCAWSVNELAEMVATGDLPPELLALRAIKCGLSHARKTIPTAERL
jgi:hypothetical protein